MKTAFRSSEICTRSHRKLIGRIDPATGDVISTSRKARDEEPSTPSTYSDTDYQKLYEQALSTIDQKDALIRELRSRLAAVEDDNRACHRLMKKAHDLLADPASGKEQVHG